MHRASPCRLLDYLGVTKSSQAVLLPMVICTMTVERFFLTSEEDSVYFALQLLAGTLVVGGCCYIGPAVGRGGQSAAGVPRDALLHRGRAGAARAVHGLSPERTVAVPRLSGDSADGRGGGRAMRRPAWRRWLWPWELRRAGVMGINRRNADYVLCVNPRKHYPRVDDKLLTKQICQQRGIRVPDTYAVIERHGDIRRFPDLLGDRQEFVIKPGQGSGGRGIVVVERHDGDGLRSRPAGNGTALADLRYHLSTILSGPVLAGRAAGPRDPRAADHPAPGVQRRGRGRDPGHPHRAVSQRAGDGHGAAAHAGLAGPGESAPGGRGGGHPSGDRDRRSAASAAAAAVWTHPDTGQSIAGLQIPDWDTVLAGAMNLADGLGLGYVGVDFVLDAAPGAGGAGGQCPAGTGDPGGQSPRAGSPPAVHRQPARRDAPIGTAPRTDRRRGRTRVTFTARGQAYRIQFWPMEALATWNDIVGQN